MADSQSTDYTERLQQHWTEQAPAWDRWADRRAGSAEDLNRALREAAGIAPGQTVLDLASGAGEPALSIAAAVAPDGQILATDLTEEGSSWNRFKLARQGSGHSAGNIEFHNSPIWNRSRSRDRRDLAPSRWSMR